MGIRVIIRCNEVVLNGIALLLIGWGFILGIKEIALIIPNLIINLRNGYVVLGISLFLVFRLVGYLSLSCCL